MPRMTKQVAVIQCTKRSKALNRTMVRPERPASIRTMPRTDRTATSSASMPRMAMPPIQCSVTLWNSRQSRPAGCSSV